MPENGQKKQMAKPEAPTLSDPRNHASAMLVNGVLDQDHLRGEGWVALIERQCSAGTEKRELVHRKGVDQHIPLC